MNMNKRAEDNKPSVGELGWQAAGVLGGGAVGYALSRILHGKPKGLRALAYILAGMGTGGMGMHYALDNIKTSDGKTWRELLRSADEMMPVWEQRRETIRNEESGSHVLTKGLAAAGLLLGGIQGASAGSVPHAPKGIDFSGRRAANNIYKHQVALRNRPGADPVAFSNNLGAGSDRAAAAINAVGGTPGVSNITLRSILRHPLESRKRNIVNMVSNRPAPDGNLNFGGLTTRGNAANIAIDTIGNAGIFGGVGLLSGLAVDASRRVLRDTKQLMEDKIYKGK